MSTRKLITVAVPAAAVLILALLGMLGNGESVADPGRVGQVMTAARASQSLPFASSVSLALAGDGEAVRLGSDAVTADGEAGPEASLLGRVRGRLVDQAGQAVAGEPVYLLRERDTWADPADARPDEDPADRLLEQGVSAADGRFELPARAGRRHELLAGGGKWAMESVDRVSSGDDLAVLMRDGLVLTGQVYQADTAAPVAGARVLAAAEDNILLATAGPDGTFSVGPLPSEVGIVGAWSPGFDADTEYNVAPALGPLVLELGSGIDVSGVVVDAETDQPVPAGTVRSVMDVEARLLGRDAGLPENLVVEERDVEVAQDGSFTLGGMSSRGFTLVAESPGFVPYRYTRYKLRDVKPGTVITLNLTPLAPLTGVVKDAEDDAPVPGAHLVAHGGQGILGTAATDEDGAFELAIEGWDGRKPLWVEASDDRGATAREILDPKRYDDPLSLRLRQAFRVDALVVQDGQPVVGAEVALLGDTARVTVGRTGMDGMIELQHEPGSADLSDLHLQARYLDMQSLPVELDLEALPETPVTLDLLEGGWLVGRVVDPFGIPVPSARLDVGETGRKGSGLWDLSAHSQEDGAFRLGPLRADVPQDLVVRAEGFDRRTLKQLLPGTGELLIQLDPVVEWKGQVISASTGQPMTRYSARLQRLTEGAKPRFKTTKARVKRKVDEPGSFSVPLPEPGTYRMRVSASDHMASTSEPVVFNGIVPPSFVTMMIWPAAVLEVTVEDATGRPVPGYSVAVIPWQAAAGADLPGGKLRKQGRARRTNSEGRASFNLGEGGAFRVAGGPGVWFENLMLAVTPGPVVQRLYHLPPTGDLEVTVVDEAGAPMSDVVVYARTHKSEKQHSIFRRASLRHGDHVAFFEALPQALYEIEVRRRGYSAHKRQLMVHGRGIERMTIELQPRNATKASSQAGQTTHKGR